MQIISGTNQLSGIPCITNLLHVEEIPIFTSQSRNSRFVGDHVYIWHKQERREQIKFGRAVNKLQQIGQISISLIKLIRRGHLLV